nr:immunoglobulin light chain junction region [Macaca mulatta]
DYYCYSTDSSTYHRVF